MAQISPFARRRGVPHRPMFQPPPPSKYKGLDDIVNFLSGGINESQFSNLARGHTGTGGFNIGNADGGRNPQGLFQGLSPYAVHFLTNSGLLEKQAPELLPTEGLEGDELFRNNLMNTLRGQQSGTYKLRGGVDASFLEDIFSMNPMGQSAYMPGFNSEGQLPSKIKPFRPPKPGPGPGPRRGKKKRPLLKNRKPQGRGGMRTGPTRPGGGSYW